MENNAKKLLEKYRSGNCTPQEQAMVEEWYLRLPFARKAPDHGIIEASKEEVYQRLKLTPKPGFIIRLKHIAVAASILICITAGLIYFVGINNTLTPVAKTQLKDVLPGRNKAILTLANGRVVDLDQAKNGEIASQHGIIIRKSHNGQLEYEIQEDASGLAGSNTISTPRGGQYQVSLPDGTKIWLNAATSLKYPSAFASNERVVELNGEAYFEVAKDQKRPFRVKTAQQTVEVLGTHFNINAYRDEPSTKTTLLEGSVKVNHTGTEVRLNPGDQARLTLANNALTTIRDVDVEQETAWKNDVFSFNDDDLKTVMRQISRWYDIDVVYQGKISNDRYFGEIPRNNNLSEVFKILELNHVHIDISGKTLTVTGN
ncbi:FecR family protein [Pedobacter frigidisoli]|uniref:FecR family protein n=1 Tax=Pedobacter frigidisoli TaxID=2530455 RepID=UPI00292D6224|nr:FecR domain-containing protein [Pedobacter frigidisoli]